LLKALKIPTFVGVFDFEAPLPKR